MSRLPVAGSAAATCLVPFLFLPASALGTVVFASGLVFCVGILLARPGAVTVVAAAAIGQVAVPREPPLLPVLLTAVLLAATLVLAEGAESGRASLGVGQVFAAHSATTSLGVAGVGAALLAGRLGSVSSIVAVAASLIAVGAAAGLLLLLIRDWRAAAAGPDR
jgi:hypothetical protein